MSIESENIKKLRKEFKLTQQQLADSIGVSKQYLSRVENASCEELLSMAQQYNIEIEKGNSKQEKKLIYCQKGH